MSRTFRSGLARAQRTQRRVVRLAHETRAMPHPVRAVSRWAAFAAIKPFSSTVSTTLDGIQYFVSTSDQSVGRLAFMGTLPDGDLADEIFRLLEQELGRHPLRGRLLVEVGANIGTTTLPAVLHQGASGVLALEPEPSNLWLLRANIAANGLDDGRVQVLPVAASDHAGEAAMEVAKTNSGDSRIRTASDGLDLYGENRREVIPVRVERLDDLLANRGVEHDDIGLVWIDTQGHEGQVLGGAPNLLRSNVPIVTEYWPYGLRRADGLDVMHDLITASGRRVLDLRASVKTGQLVEIGPDELPLLPDTYTNESYTDLALLPVTS
jgi:FkbM family methyltransferase